MAKRKTKPAAEITAPDTATLPTVPPDDWEDPGYEAYIDVHVIFPSDKNPRKHFDEKELQDLADSLRNDGQLQNITVRAVPDGSYQIVGGERRWRAAKLAGLPQLRCRVIVISDEKAIELRGIENYRRSQLNAIEEATWFQQMLDTGKYNQTSLAEYLGISHGQVSNRLRLLNLPEVWQDMVVHGRLPPTHARLIAGWTHRPVVLGKLQEAFEESSLEELNVGELEEELAEILFAMSRTMDETAWNGPRFELTDDIKQQLDIEECPGRYGAGRVTRAFNVELWDKLQEAAKTAAQEAAEAQRSSGGSASSRSSGSGSSESDADVSHLHDYKLTGHWLSHVGAVLSSHLKPADGISMRLFLAEANDSTMEPLTEWLLNRADLKADGIFDEADSWRATAAMKVTAKSLPGLIHEFMVNALAQGESQLSLHLLMQACRELNLDPLAKWQPDEELLSLCSTSQLREVFTEEMAPEKSVKKWNKERLIKEALANWPAGHIPVLLRAKALDRPLVEPDADDEADGSDDDGDDGEE